MFLFRATLIVSYFYLLHLLTSSSFPFSSAQLFPRRPVLTESFYAEIEVQNIDTESQYTTTGEGFIGRDYKKLNQLIYYLYITNSEYPITYYELKRYDMQQIFIVKEGGRGERSCVNQSFVGPFGEVWGWVRQAKHVETVTVDGNRFDVWNRTEGNTIQSLWVNRKDIHRPIRYIAENINVNVSVVNFKIYFPSPPTDPDEFVVPPMCKESPLPTAKHYMDFSQDFDDTENE